MDRLATEPGGGARWHRKRPNRWARHLTIVCQGKGKSDSTPTALSPDAVKRKELVVPVWHLDGALRESSVSRPGQLPAVPETGCSATRASPRQNAPSGANGV